MLCPETCRSPTIPPWNALDGRTSGDGGGGGTGCCASTSTTASWLPSMAARPSIACARTFGTEPNVASRAIAPKTPAKRRGDSRAIKAWLGYQLAAAQVNDKSNWHSSWRFFTRARPRGRRPGVPRRVPAPPASRSRVRRRRVFGPPATPAGRLLHRRTAAASGWAPSAAQSRSARCPQRMRAHTRARRGRHQPSGPALRR